MAWLWRVMRPWAVPMLRVGLKTKRVEGKEHVPKEGPAIIASNHLSSLDHVVLPMVTKRVIYNISKAEAFESPVKGWFFKHWGVIPLKRGTGDQAAFNRARQVIQEGKLFCIYPEGTRSLDGKLHKGHTGVARLALEFDVPVIPVAMLGTFERKPKGKKGMNRGVATGAIVGEPMRWPQHKGKQADREICRQVTDEIMHRLAELSGQEYVHEYQFNPEVPGYDRKSD